MAPFSPCLVRKRPNPALANQKKRRCDQLAMTENSDLEKRLSDLERRHEKTRELLISALSFAVSMLAVFHFQPEGLLALVGVVWGAMAATHVLAEWLLKQRMKERKINWELTASICGILLGVLSVLVYAATFLVVSSSSLLAMVLTMFLPVIAQGYWIWAVWADTGTLFHPLTQLCVAWVALLGVWFLANYMFANQRPLQSN
jgi:hypothetical protein